MKFFNNQVFIIWLIFFKKVDYFSHFYFYGIYTSIFIFFFIINKTWIKSFFCENQNMDKRLNKELEVCFCRYHLCSNCSINPLIFVSLFPSAQIDFIIRHAVIGSNTYYAVVIGETWKDVKVHWRMASKEIEEVKAS